MSHPPTVLCIDDDVLFLAIRKALLESHDFRVFTADNGPAGLEIVEHEPIDVVILDYHMTGMDGGRVATELRRRHPDIPVLMSSGLAEIPGSVLSIVDGVVVKGSSSAVLIQEIQRVTTSSSKRPEQTPRIEIERQRREHPRGRATSGRLRRKRAR